MELFDSHAHYNDEKFDTDRELVIKQIFEAGVTKVINAGYSLEASKFALKIAEKYDWMYTISGISPNDIPDNEKSLGLELSELVKFLEENKNSKKIVAIGEIGLDYYWNTDNIELQKNAFIKQI